MINLEKITKQKGFTLIEMLVVLTIVSILAWLLMNSYDNSRSKAQVMMGLAKQMADANMALKSDTGCYVNRPDALFNITESQKAANNYCGRVFGNSWTHAYMAQFPVDATGDILADKISSGVTASFERKAGGVGQQYYIRFSNVPMDVVKQALLECNNSDATQGDSTFATSRCYAGAAMTTTAPTTFDMLYDTTR